MNTGENKIEKKDMQNIHGGNENKGKPGTPAKQPKGKCAFDNGSCCRRTELCDTGSNG